MMALVTIRNGSRFVTHKNTQKKNREGRKVIGDRDEAEHGMGPSTISFHCVLIQAKASCESSKWHEMSFVLLRAYLVLVLPPLHCLFPGSPDRSLSAFIIDNFHFAISPKTNFLLRLIQLFLKL